MNAFDVRMVRRMANSTEATQPGPNNEQPAVVVIDLPDHPVWPDIARQVKAHLAWNQAVLFMDFPGGPQHQWNPEQIGLLLGTSENDLTTNVMWQCTYFLLSTTLSILTLHTFTYFLAAVKRDRYLRGLTEDSVEIFSHGEVSEFLASISNEGMDAFNLLDFPVEHGWNPALIKYVVCFLVLFYVPYHWQGQLDGGHPGVEENMKSRRSREGEAAEFRPKPFEPRMPCP